MSNKGLKGWVSKMFGLNEAQKSSNPQNPIKTTNDFIPLDVVSLLNNKDGVRSFYSMGMLAILT